MASQKYAESEIDFEAEYVVYLQAQYEEISKNQEAEEQFLNYLMKVKQGDEQTLNFLIEKSRKNVEEMKSKIQEVVQRATPLTVEDLDKLGVLKKEIYAEQQMNPEKDSSEAKVKNGGHITPREQTCSGEQNTNHVQALGDEATSSPVSRTGAPPGCDGPRPKCLDVGGGMPPERVSTDSRHRSPNEETENNNKVVVWELRSPNVSVGNEKNVDMKDYKVAETMEKIDTKKNEKKKNEKKKEKKRKAEKVKVRRGFLSCILCCFGRKENRSTTKENIIKETTV